MRFFPIAVALGLGLAACAAEDLPCTVPEGVHTMTVVEMETSCPLDALAYRLGSPGYFGGGSPCGVDAITVVDHYDEGGPHCFASNTFVAVGDADGIVSVDLDVYVTGCAPSLEDCEAHWVFGPLDRSAIED